MKNAERIIAQLKSDEKFEPFVYRCPAGFWTVGYGRNLEKRGVTETEAHYLLVNDVRLAWAECSAQIPCFTHLDEVRKAVLVNMAFNLGIRGLLRFRRMLAALEAGDYAGAAAEMIDSNWYRQVGIRSRRLVRMMRTGQWPE